MSNSAPEEPELPARPHISGERRELHAWLHRRSPELGDLYAGALELLFGIKILGRSRFVAHAVREIANRLPDGIAGEQATLEGAKRIQPTHQLDAIAAIWIPLPAHDVGAAVQPRAEATEAEAPSARLLSVTEFKKLDKLIGEWIESKRNAPERMAALIMALAPENRAAPDILGPVIRQWSDITKYFVAVAHGKDASDDELIRQFELFEQSLISLSGSFYPRLDQLDEILGRANT
jgi:hypothetical protein